MSESTPDERAGQRPGQRFESEAFVPDWGGLHDLQEMPSSASARWRFLLLVSTLVGSLAVVSALGVWPRMAALQLGLTARGTFHLLASGLYLLAMTLYVVCRTAALHRLDQAMWDVRLMAYVSLAVSGFVILVLGIAAFALVGLIGVFVWPVSALLNQAGAPSDG